MSTGVIVKKLEDIRSAVNQISILFIGPCGAGKTSLITKLHEDKFTCPEMTIGIDIIMIGVTINGEDYRVQLVDTAGLEKYAHMMDSYYRSTHGAMLVYDITKYESYDDIKNWLQQVRQRTDKAEYPVILLGNKIDMDMNYAHHIDGKRVAEDLEMDGYFETSAKSGEGIKDAIKLLINLIVSRNNNLSEDQYNIKLSPQSHKRKENCC